jgi:predicted ATP-dependent protease
MVDGDSASLAESCALLSNLANVPIKQSLAITGSLNQFGQAQAIGGVNEKVEGFFDICKARGLTGKQGVLIPSSNAKHLMLRNDVVQEVRAGRFFIHAVDDVDQAIELLTGVPAGEPDEDGNVPEGTVNYLVSVQLIALSQVRKAYISHQKESRSERRQKGAMAKKAGPKKPGPKKPGANKR